MSLTGKNSEPNGRIIAKVYKHVGYTELVAVVPAAHESGDSGLIVADTSLKRRRGFFLADRVINQGGLIYGPQTGVHYELPSPGEREEYVRGMAWYEANKKRIVDKGRFNWDRVKRVIGKFMSR